MNKIERLAQRRIAAATPDSREHIKRQLALFFYPLLTNDPALSPSALCASGATPHSEAGGESAGSNKGGPGRVPARRLLKV